MVRNEHFIDVANDFLCLRWHGDLNVLLRIIVVTEGSVLTLIVLILLRVHFLRLLGVFIFRLIMILKALLLTSV